MASNKIRIAAFGALNQGSYDEFAAWLDRYAMRAGLPVEIKCAGPYPNAAAVSEPGRPLRGDALKDPALKEELFAAVAADARALGPDFDYYCMPCMSMIGFHDGVERMLGRRIVRLADALKDFYREVPQVGVIHMRPARDRIVEIFGGKAVTPDEEQAAKLLEAEDLAKQQGDSAPVENVMRDITESFRDRGLTHVLFARADAPGARNGPAGKVPGIEINGYFDILARYLTGLPHA